MSPCIKFAHSVCALAAALLLAPGCTEPAAEPPGGSEPDARGAAADAMLAGATDAEGSDSLTEAVCALAITSPPTGLGLDSFYKQYLDVGGIPVVASGLVEPAALPIACTIMVHMLLLRPDVREEMARNRIRVGIMAATELTTDMPEHSDLYEVFPGTDWDTRARGLGATLQRPLSSVGEENLLQLVTDRYLGESIMVHEFAHSMFLTGVITQPELASRDVELETLYQNALAAGTWSDTYAETNRQEYFAEAVQSFYDTNLESEPANGIHGHLDTRAELSAEDPGVFLFIGKIFDASDSWRP